MKEQRDTDVPDAWDDSDDDDDATGVTTETESVTVKDPPTRSWVWRTARGTTSPTARIRD